MNLIPVGMWWGDQTYLVLEHYLNFKNFKPVIHIETATVVVLQYEICKVVKPNPFNNYQRLLMLSLVHYDDYVDKNSNMIKLERWSIPVKANFSTKKSWQNQ